MKISQLFPSKFVKAADLNGKTITLTIAKTVMEQVGHGADAENKLVLYFAKATKGMIMNATNARAVAGLYGDDTDKWVGQRISVYATTVKAFGSTHAVIRVRDEVPAQPKPQATAVAEETNDLDDAEDITDQDVDFTPSIVQRPEGDAGSGVHANGEAATDDLWTPTAREPRGVH